MAVASGLPCLDTYGAIVSRSGGPITFLPLLLKKGGKMGAPMSDKGFAVRVTIGAAIFVASLVLSIVAAASAADAFSFGFRTKPSSRQLAMAFSG